MERQDLDAALEDIPLFNSLSADEKNIIKEKSSVLEYKKGQVIYEEGSAADAFYCVVYGRVLAYARNDYNKEEDLEYLHRGKYFGIISLLTGDNHSVTTKAINDSAILVIRKKDFEAILKAIPKLAIDLSLTLSRRLKDKKLHPKKIFESSVISVFSSYSQAGKSIYALNLALSLKKETRKSVIIFEFADRVKHHSLPRKLNIKSDVSAFDFSSSQTITPEGLGKIITRSEFGVDLFCAYYQPDCDNFLKKFVGILSVLVNDYHYIVVDLPSLMDIGNFEILNQSDLIHVLSSPDEVDLKRTFNLIQRLKNEFHFQDSKIKIIINGYKISKLTFQQQVDILDANIFATIPKIDLLSTDRLVLDKPDCEYSKALRRISRNIGDCVVGLALGVGFAYGLSHIGVLKVIEDNKIPIDMISGSSIGALIASLWVTGRSSSEIMDIVNTEFKEPKYLWNIVDLTFPSMGFLKGNKLYSFFKKYLGNKTFQDVKLPLVILASDVKRKETIILNKGLLADAIMASCSMPGVFAPFRVKEEILLDGGIINPLPTEILYKMGARKIIAVNVTPSKDDIVKQYELVKDQVNIKLSDVLDINKKYGILKQYLKDKFRTNILDLVFSSIEIMQSEVAQKEGQLADVLLHPNTQGLYWLELHRAKEFYQRGQDEALKHLDKILQLINE